MKVPVLTTTMLLLGMVACSVPQHKPNAAAPQPPAVNYTIRTYPGQLISDYKVGQIMGEVHCGTRPFYEAMVYLQAMGISFDENESYDKLPDAVAGFQQATRNC